MPDTYSSQYREMVLIQVRAGRSVYDLAEGLEVSAATIFRWKRQDQIDAGTAVGLSSQDGAELRAARLRIAELEKELATVKRASELFSQGRVVRPKELFPIVEQLGVEGHGRSRRAACCRLRHQGSSCGDTGHHRHAPFAGRGSPM
jgi:transposase